MNTSSPALMTVRDLSRCYEQRHTLAGSKFAVQAFGPVNLSIRRGANLALIGESGAGKSTLARCLCLLEKPSAGEIWFEGENVLALGRGELAAMRRHMQLIFQDPASALNPRLTAAEIVAEPLLIQKEGTARERRQIALDAMLEVGLRPEWERKRASEFSGGQKQRLAIARALTLRPKLLILDEALASLDIANQEQILRLLSDLQAAHSLTYVHVSHDLRLVSQFADEIAVMHEGKIVEQEPAAKLFAQPRHSYTQELLLAMPPLESIFEERFA